MKKSIIILPFILLLGILLCSCNKDPKKHLPEVEHFEELEDEGLIIENRYKFTYNKQNCQRVVNKKRKIIHLQTDSQSSYMRINLENISGLPAKEDIVNFTIAYKKQDDVSENVVSLAMVVLKAEEGKIWAWNEESKTGVIIKL